MLFRPAVAGLQRARGDPPLSLPVAFEKDAKCERMGERVNPGNRPMSSEYLPTGVIEKRTINIGIFLMP